eukprot:3813588-Prymnesium_polylepis.1
MSVAPVVCSACADTTHRVIPPLHSPDARCTPPPARRPVPRPPRGLHSLPVCAQSRPRDGPGVPRPRGLRAGGAPDRTA